MSSAPPPYPPRSNDTAIAVVVGVVLLLAAFVFLGIFVATRFLRGTRITQSRQGTQNTVDIHSPVGDLHVQGDGENGKVQIRSPFGDIDVNGQPNLAGLDLDIYPGSTLVQPHQASVFSDNAGDDDRYGLAHIRSGGAQVQLRSGNSSLNVDAAEFLTSAAPQQVLAFYSGRLARFGSVRREDQRHDEVSLTVKLSDSNERAVMVRPAPDGTHFLLVRIAGGAAAK